MTANALDTAGFVNFSAAKAWGALAIGIYVDGNGLQQPMGEQAAAVGMGLFSFVEFQPSAPLSGAEAGTRDATNGVGFAQRIGQPKGTALYLANDEAVPSWGWSATLAYFQAAASVIVAYGYVPGFYGQTVVWDDVKKYGYRYFCHAPDGTNDTSEANIICEYQGQANVTAAGMFVDIDLIQTPADFGGWNADGPFPKPEPPEETSMFIESHDGKALYEKVVHQGESWLHQLPANLVGTVPAAMVVKDNANGGWLNRYAGKIIPAA